MQYADYFIPKPEFQFMYKPGEVKPERNLGATSILIRVSFNLRAGLRFRVHLF